MSGVLATVFDVAGGVANKAQGVVDGVFPPDQRERAASKLQVFAANHPKIAALLIANVALSGVPFLMFLVFSLSVFVFSLIATIFLAILVTVFFTSLMVGIALLFLLPILFGTTFGASFLFFWGLVGYYILTWLNGGESPVEEGTAVGDRLHRVTGGRLRYFTDGAYKDVNSNSTKKLDGEKDQNGMKPQNGLDHSVKLETY